MNFKKEELVKSPLNYVGGKHKLLPQLLPLFPNIHLSVISYVMFISMTKAIVLFSLPPVKSFELVS